MYDYSLEQFETCNGSSGVTTRVGPNPPRFLHYKCEYWSFDTKTVSQSMGNWEQV